jgi:hypothetical protein
MCKKFLSLVLVLALSTIASAITLSFVGGGDGSSWGDSDNWASGTTYQEPTISDFARPTGNAVTVNTTGAACDKLQFRGVANGWVTIQNGMDLETNGSVEMDSSTTGSSVGITIDAGGTLNACTQSGNTSAFTAFKLGRDARTGDSIVNVNGTLNVVSVDAVEKSELNIGVWNNGATGGGGGSVGTWALNIGSTGTVNADVLSVDVNPADGTSLIDITNGGVMVLAGDVRNNIGGWIANGFIIGDSGASGVAYDYGVSNAGKTTVYIPEPATIALLSLGGLLLRKRR